MIFTSRPRCPPAPSLGRRKFLITILIGLIFTFPSFADGANDANGTDLEVVVDGAPNNRGRVLLAIFSEVDAALFPDGLPALKQSVPATGRAVTFRFNNLPAGRYAALAFHDENDNEILDRNFLGIPKELWGVTGRRPFGKAPRFLESTFLLDKDHRKITIHLK